MLQQNSIKLIVGLGNPGRRYARTRHNIGFLCVDELARRANLLFARRRARALIAVGVVAERDVVLAKPQEFMNLSGGSVRGLLRWLRAGPSSLLVVYDDLDLPFGRLRLRPRGQAAGHRGVQSIIDRLGTDAFPRLRVGIGRPEPQDAVEYVLSDFSASEQEHLPAILERAAITVEGYLTGGLEAAMNRHNR